MPAPAQHPREAADQVWTGLRGSTNRQRIERFVAETPTCNGGHGSHGRNKPATDQVRLRLATKVTFKLARSNAVQRNARPRQRARRLVIRVQIVKEGERHFWAVVCFALGRALRQAKTPRVVSALAWVVSFVAISWGQIVGVYVFTLPFTGSEVSAAEMAPNVMIGYVMPVWQAYFVARAAWRGADAGAASP